MAKKVKANSKPAKDIEEEIVDLENEEEVLEDVDFDLDIDDVNELESELEPVSAEERLIRVEKNTKLLVVLQSIGLVLMLITMILCIANSNGSSSKSTDTEEEETTTSEDYTYSTDAFTEISVSDISSVSKKKEVVIWLGRQGCYWCSLYAPIIGLSAQDNDYDVYYIDFAKIVDFSAGSVTDSEAYETLVSWIEDSDYASNIEEGIGTPLTFFVKNNKIVNMIGGYVDEDGLNEYLEEEGFIK